ncbi:MAG: class I SAM-dependent methyltransferase [Candidatus Thorarchaeota archaeon]
MIKFFYNFLYKYLRAPWDIGPREELVSLVNTGKIKPCKVIDLGSGTASNCLFLAEKGFDVTGVDYSPAAIQKGRFMARQSGVHVNFILDDLTNIRYVKGKFDFLIDYGTFDDLNPSDRILYIKNILPMTRKGTKFLLFCFEWTHRWWERLLIRTHVIGALALEPGEVFQRFGKFFVIKPMRVENNNSIIIPRVATYLMTRK